MVAFGIDFATEDLCCSAWKPVSSQSQCKMNVGLRNSPKNNPPGNPLRGDPGAGGSPFSCLIESCRIDRFPMAYAPHTGKSADVIFHAFSTSNSYGKTNYILIEMPIGRPPPGRLALRQIISAN